MMILLSRVEKSLVFQNICLDCPKIDGKPPLPRTRLVLITGHWRHNERKTMTLRQQIFLFLTKRFCKESSGKVVTIFSKDECIWHVEAQLQ
ncbi:Hypothetical predicted protein [Octopus vulgaris]|uniref:Uncharacterized protein n=1 Tax=Octopus vulgaris TaxID=6645 RepID=A0AA36F7P2_OCTVU|nr:Hypothetical predicted protein [Octopus vulgaris]